MEKEKMMIRYALNNELNGIEIYFDEKPGDIIRDSLKKLGYRWNRKKACWYAKQREDRLELAERLTAGRAEAERIMKQEEQNNMKTAIKTVEDLNKAAEGYTFEQTGEGRYAGWTGCNYSHTSTLGRQERKKVMLAELKKHGIKATCRTSRGSYNFTVTVPENMKMSEEEYIKNMMNDRADYWYTDLEGNQYHRNDMQEMDYEEAQRIKTEHYARMYRKEKAVPCKEFRKFVETVIRSFNHDHSDVYTDYFDVGFYSSFDWK